MANLLFHYITFEWVWECFDRILIKIKDSKKRKNFDGRLRCLEMEVWEF